MYSKESSHLHVVMISFQHITHKWYLKRYQEYLRLYTSFLNEKTFNPETGRQDWKHEKLRTASLSLSSFTLSVHV